MLTDRGETLLAEENADFKPHQGIDEFGHSFPPFLAFTLEDIEQKAAKEKGSAEDVSNFDIKDCPESLLNRVVANR